MEKEVEREVEKEEKEVEKKHVLDADALVLALESTDHNTLIRYSTHLFCTFTNIR